ncbi:SDR family oxidoreductase [Halomarina salina]|uniref:SDR family oxidoreductase n=1 Tax=Halomarina salina TaxID=1872699 RepID=A0ABD5RTV4_9EURY
MWLYRYCRCELPAFVEESSVLLDGGALGSGRGEREEHSRNESRTPLPYLGTPDGIGAMTAFLASDYARFITGQSFVVNDG